MIVACLLVYAVDALVLPGALVSPTTLRSGFITVFMLGAGLMAAQEKIAASMERAEDAAKAARLRQNDII